MSREVETVRRFHRLVTQRAGALEEHFLGRERPLGQSRVLFEIGREGATLRALRARLGLDSGYLTRLVQALIAEGLVELEAGSRDERVRRARLTDRGRAEFDEIDRRSDEAARTILGPLSESQAAKLVSAMDEVHRLLSLGALRIEALEPDAPEARWCLERYFRELENRFDDGFDISLSIVADSAAYAAPRGVFLVGTIDGRAVSCGAVTLVEPGVGYIKRMWVDGSLRGFGLGRRMLTALEAAAARLGCRKVQLETNRSLTEAIRMYRTAGYAEVDAFNDEIYAHHWFQKSL